MLTGRLRAQCAWVKRWHIRFDDMVTLGTPLSPSATKVMLLGAGELGKEVLIALQRLGV
ncbi:MAG: formate-dependent phosphoribosylglycinamide formyltransferase, partial [Pseudomonadota bacterium]